MMRLIVAVAFTMLMAGCLAGELELEPAAEAMYEPGWSEAGAEEIPATPADEMGTGGPRAFAEEIPATPAGEMGTGDPDGYDELFCEPGPSSNWCQNVIGSSCSAPGTHRRCFLPSYCEWFFCTCSGGTWGDCV
jgi:hypothetical protein